MPDLKIPEKPDLQQKTGDRRHPNLLRFRPRLRPNQNHDPKIRTIPKLKIHYFSSPGVFGAFFDPRRPFRKQQPPSQPKQILPPAPKLHITQTTARIRRYPSVPNRLHQKPTHQHGEPHFQAILTTMHTQPFRVGNHRVRQTIIPRPIRKYPF